MKEQVYKWGFPRASRLIVFMSLIAVLGFMATFLQDYTHHEKRAIQDQVYEESLYEIESLFVMSVR